MGEKMCPVTTMLAGNKFHCAKPWHGKPTGGNVYTGKPENPAPGDFHRFVHTYPDPNPHALVYSE